MIATYVSKFLRYVLTAPVCVYICVCKLSVKIGLCSAVVWRSRVEMDWHIHHCGDSVSEGGSQARESKRRERERDEGRKREKTREEKTGRV